MMMVEVYENQQNDEVLVAQPSDAKIEQQQQSISMEGVEHLENLMQELKQTHKKFLLVEPITNALKKEFDEVLAALLVLKNEVLHKQQEALMRNALIKEKVNILLHSGKVQVNEEEYNNSDMSVQRYADLLQSIVGDIEREFDVSSRLIAQDLPPYFIIADDEPSIFSEYLYEKSKMLKKYIKKIRKDLMVSDSRYQFGFDAQLKRIAFIEHFVAVEAQEK